MRLISRSSFWLQPRPWAGGIPPKLIWPARARIGIGPPVGKTLSSPAGDNCEVRHISGWGEHGWKGGARGVRARVNNAAVLLLVRPPRAGPLASRGPKGLAPRLRKIRRGHSPIRHRIKY